MSPVCTKMSKVRQFEPVVRRLLLKWRTHPALGRAFRVVSINRVMGIFLITVVLKAVQFRGSCAVLPNGGPVTVVWAANTPPSRKVLEITLSSVSENLAGIRVNVLCGSRKCVERALQVSQYNSCVHVSRLVAPIVAQDSLLESWMNDHVLAKLLSAHEYEMHLQLAIQLAVLWKQGGLVVSPGIKLLNIHARRIGFRDTAIFFYSEKRAFRELGGFWAAASPMRSDEVLNMIQAMLKAYNWQMAPYSAYNKSTWPVHIDWQTLCSSSATSCPKARMLDEVDMKFIYTPSIARKHLFGTLSYQARRSHLLSKKNTGMNIGDEMQGLAGIQFLPRIDAFVERDRLDVVTVIESTHVHEISRSVTSSTPPRPAEAPMTVFLNAWWGTETWVWPPPGEIQPILLAIHLEHNNIRRDFLKHVEYLNNKGPIGTRDHDTNTFLTENGLTNIFVGCLTMTLAQTAWVKEMKDYVSDITIVDVSEEALSLIPASALNGARYLSAKVSEPEIADDIVGRYVTALSMLRQYERSKLVITQRLHVALPTVAMGTPCLLILSKNLPGGGGFTGLARFSGLQTFMHVADVSDPQSLSNFSFDKPASNPNPEQFGRFQTRLQALIMCHETLSDSALKFGMVPSSWEYPPETPCVSNFEEDVTSIHIATVLTPSWLYNVFPTWLNAMASKNKHESIVLHILTGNLNPTERCIARWLTLQALPKSSVNTIPTEHLTSRGAYIGLAHIPRDTQARLYLGSLLPCIKRVIWLDLDTLVLENLQSLWSVKSPECGVNARSSDAPYVVHKWMNSRPETRQNGKAMKRTFNAGVMVLDLQRIRALRFEDTIVKYWAFELGANDQVAYNLLCNGTYRELHPKWNVYRFRQDTSKNLYAMRKQWSIIHFQGSKKPWMDASVEDTHAEIWNSFYTRFDDAL